MVIAGVLVNLLSAYLRDHVDRVLARYSATRRTQREAAELARAARMTAIAAGPEAAMFARLGELRLRAQSQSAYAMAGLNLLGAVLGVLLPRLREADAWLRFAIVVLLAQTAWLILTGLSLHLRAGRAGQEIAEAAKE